MARVGQNLKIEEVSSNLRCYILKVSILNTKKEPPPSEDGSSSRLLLHHPALIAGASARLWMPDSVLHTLPRTGEGRFSLVIGSHTPSDYADMPKAPVISYSAPSPMRIFRTIPMPFVKEERAANHTSYVYAVDTSLPVETQDRHQSTSGEAYRRFQKCCTPVWLVFSNTTRMRCWVLPGSVQLQDYYIRPEKMGAPRKDLADAILSYNGNDSQKNGEPFFQPLSGISLRPTQTCY